VELKKKEKAQGNIIVVSITILLVIVGVTIIYNVVKPLVSERGEEVLSSTEKIQLSNSLTASIEERTDIGVVVSVSRAVASPGCFSRIEYALDTDNGLCYVEQNGTLDPGELDKKFVVDTTSCSGYVNSVSAEPILGDAEDCIFVESQVEFFELESAACRSDIFISGGIDGTDLANMASKFGDIDSCGGCGETAECSECDLETNVCLNTICSNGINDWSERSDITRDGHVDGTDLANLAKYFGTFCIPHLPISYSLTRNSVGVLTTLEITNNDPTGEGILMVAEDFPEGAVLVDSSFEPDYISNDVVVWIFNMADGIPDSVSYSLDSPIAGAKGKWASINLNQEGEITNV
jgi:hypothetical protein